MLVTRIGIAHRERTSAPVCDDVTSKCADRLFPQIFTEVFSREQQLIRADPRHSTYLACGLIMRGNATISDINRNVARIRPSLRMAHWNSEAGSWPESAEREPP